jgi:ribosomal protein S18 acetylase RimI-like enzyme
VIIRPATLDDAPAMGRVMVRSWLAAHRGQVPEEAWRQRLDEWTPDVSAEAWARLLAEMADGTAERHVLLVAEDGPDVTGMALAVPAGDDATPGTAEVSALYVAPDRQGDGIGTALLRACAGELLGLGYTSLQIGVLTANVPARGFYRAMGGREVGRRTFDEEGHELAGTVYAWPDLATLAG